MAAEFGKQFIYQFYNGRGTFGRKAGIYLCVAGWALRVSQPGFSNVCALICSWICVYAQCV